MALWLYGYTGFIATARIGHFNTVFGLSLWIAIANGCNKKQKFRHGLSLLLRLHSLDSRSKKQTFRNCRGLSLVRLQGDFAGRGLKRKGAMWCCGRWARCSAESTDNVQVRLVSSQQRTTWGGPVYTD